MNEALLTRRDWLVQSGAMLSVAMLGLRGHRAPTTRDPILHQVGGYRYLPGAPFLSFGVVAADGFEIVRTTFRRPPRFAEGLQTVERHLEQIGRPIHALCGIELRSPRIPTPQEFGALNRMYMEQYDRRGLLVNGKVPVARTNVVTGVEALSIHAFSYTIPVVGFRVNSPTFVLSAIPELRNLQRAAAGAEPPDFVASGDTTPSGAPTFEALKQKTEFVLYAADRNLQALGVAWRHATAVQLYTLENVHALLEPLILPGLGAAADRGVHWHHAHPPGAMNLIEIDVRGVRSETVW